MWHLQTVERGLDEAERWLEQAMAGHPGIEELRTAFNEWMTAQAAEQGLAANALRAYEFANPPGMSADGLFRYWNKVRPASIASRDMSDGCHAEAVMHETCQEPKCPIY